MAYNDKTKESKRKISTLTNTVPFFASSLNGLLFAPLELGSTSSKSTTTNIRGFKIIPHVYKTEGLRALWNGSGWFVLANTTSRTIWLMSYDHLKYSLSRNKNEKLTNIQLMGAGFGAGAITAFLSNPIWTLKSFANLPNYPGILYPINIPLSHFLKNPLKFYNEPTIKEYRNLSHTPKTLMSGTIPAIGYVATESMFQLFILEKLKEFTKDYTNNLNPFNTGLFGGLLGGISRIVILPVTFPLHVVTLRFREQNKPILQDSSGIKSFIQNPNKQNVKQIISGIHKDRAWYAGIGPYTARVVPQASILFFMVEGFKSLIK